MIPKWLNNFDDFKEVVWRYLGRDDLTEEQLEEVFTQPFCKSYCDSEWGHGWLDSTWLMWLKNRLPLIKIEDRDIFEDSLKYGDGYCSRQHRDTVAHLARPIGQRTKLGHTTGG